MENHSPIPGKIQLGSGKAIEAYLEAMVLTDSGFYDLGPVGDGLVFHLAGTFLPQPARVQNLLQSIYVHFQPHDYPYVDRAMRELIQDYDRDFMAMRRNFPDGWDQNGLFRYRFFRWAGDVMILALR